MLKYNAVNKPLSLVDPERTATGTECHVTRCRWIRICGRHRRAVTW